MKGGKGVEGWERYGDADLDELGEEVLFCFFFFSFFLFFFSFDLFLDSLFSFFFFFFFFFLGKTKGKKGPK